MDSYSELQLMEVVVDAWRLGWSVRLEGWSCSSYSSIKMRVDRPEYPKAMPLPFLPEFHVNSGVWYGIRFVDVEDER